MREGERTQSAGEGQHQGKGVRLRPFDVVAQPRLPTVAHNVVAGARSCGKAARRPRAVQVSKGGTRSRWLLGGPTGFFRGRASRRLARSLCRGDELGHAAGTLLFARVAPSK